MRLRKAMFGIRLRFSRGKFVLGLLTLSVSHRSMADRSYVSPSAVCTGSAMIVCRSGSGTWSSKSGATALHDILFFEWEEGHCTPRLLGSKTQAVARRALRTSVRVASA